MSFKLAKKQGVIVKLNQIIDTKLSIKLKLEVNCK